MATRLRKTHQDDVRAKIQASQLINRLTDHALGTVELSPTQVQAINILLKKSLADLTAVQLSGPGEGGEHLHKIVREIVDPANPHS